ncbi:hypothetical protein [Methylobacterium sp. PvR107]|uniref:hypothetical protein n=1 Tax=Methylobacterium sp. PvR107 TaxID=2806597 RepID=UPI001AE70C4C|nr:hypothetical protein [Methylobacterium sp. PvR107]MBP1180756.1 hypothetical protein [Methylobacterium sp. PvR107]
MSNNRTRLPGDFKSQHKTSANFPAPSCDQNDRVSGQHWHSSIWQAAIWMNDRPAEIFVIANTC